MGGPWGHYARRNKAGEDKYCMISLICGTKGKNMLTDAKNSLVVARGEGWGASEMSKRDQKVQTSSYK